MGCLEVNEGNFLRALAINHFVGVVQFSKVYLLSLAALPFNVTRKNDLWPDSVQMSLTGITLKIDIPSSSYVQSRVIYSCTMAIWELALC